MVKFSRATLNLGRIAASDWQGIRSHTEEEEEERWWVKTGEAPQEIPNPHPLVQEPPGADTVSARSPGKTSQTRPAVSTRSTRESWSQKIDCGNWTESNFIEPPTKCLDRLNCLGSYKSLSADCVRSQSHPLCVISWEAGLYLSPAMLNEWISLVWSEQMRFWALVGQ